MIRRLPTWLSLVSAVLLIALTGPTRADDEEGFETLFDGSNLDKWTLVNKHGDGYIIEDGVLVCPADGGGNLFTTKEHANFIFRFEYRLEPGGNNGVGIRAPFVGDAAYMGMEIQILDDTAEQYATLQPYQYHGSVYGIFPSERGAPKPAGEWNTEEIMCDGGHIRVTVNDKVIVDANLDDVEDTAVEQAHPGMFRVLGHVGFLGHGSRLEFRNIRIKDLPGPDQGFTSLFDTSTMEGWVLKGKPEGWKVAGGALHSDGAQGGEWLRSEKEYGDFIFKTEWKISPGGNSGVFIRSADEGAPWLTGYEVQISNDPRDDLHCTGALYGYAGVNPRPDESADTWHTFEIHCIGSEIKVVADGVTCVDVDQAKLPVPEDKAYPEPKGKPVKGYVGLQDSHSPAGHYVEYRNVRIKEVEGRE